MYHITTYRFRIIGLALLSVLLMSCKKWVVIDDPTDSLTTPKMFRTEKLAESALAGVYNSLAQGPNQDQTYLGRGFAAGLASYAGGLSAAEVFSASNTSNLAENNTVYGSYFWSSAYHAIYLANSVIEGIAGSESELLRDSVRAQYTAEAKLLRAFSYEYLLRYFGDVPLVLTVDFNQTKQMPRTPTAEVNQQIIADLSEAYAVLPPDCAPGQGERVRANKWVAAALLARHYLYEGDFQRAESYASEVIQQGELFQLEALSNVFLKESREAIFQLAQSTEGNQMKNAAIDGYLYLPDPLYTGLAYNYLSDALVQAFEPGDLRAEHWLDSTLQTDYFPEPQKVWYPSKYKVGKYNSVLGAPAKEYNMVIRLAEMYLIRAEARAQGAGSGTAGALDDLNVLRNRAGLEALESGLNASEVLDAVWHARQVELFAEWGHRWLDLKRSGKAEEVLSKVPNNQPWEGDWQLLYPIPESEIKTNNKLIQNPGYDARR